MPTTPTRTTASHLQLSGVIQDVKRAWRAGQSTDMAGVIREHPEVVHNRTFMVDLAYEAYCLRESRGQTPETSAFLQEMPAFRTQIRDVILGHRELADHFEAVNSELTAWPDEGSRLESLTILCELGRGSFARVYLAQDANMGDRNVVLKLSAVPSGEGRTLGTMQQPSIVSVLWARRLGELSAICMPYVGSTTLGDVIEAVREKGLKLSRRAGMILTTIEKTSVVPANAPDDLIRPVISETESYVRAIARIGIPLAEALAYLHAKGIVHGDIKPSNILLDHSARPYLIDFNMAQREEDWLLRFGGTLPYMAPESLNPARPKCSAAAAEIYSLGVVLYECLSGRVPHEPSGSDLRDVARDQFARKRLGCVPIRSLNRNVPRRMARAIDACLSVEPDLRPTAEVLARDLRAVTRPRRWLRLFGLLAVVLALGFLAQVFVQSKLEPPADFSDLPEETPSTHEEYFRRGVAFLEASKVTLAMNDFDVARGIKAEGKTLAHLGYCLSKSGRDREAESLYAQAISGGYAPAWVHNNRAFSSMQFGQNVDSLLKQALKSARLARDLDPGSREIRLNWVLARFLVAMGGKPKSFNDPECVKELRAVLADGVVDADLCIKAAWICSASGPKSHDEAFQHIRHAVNLGRDPKSVLQDPFLRMHLGMHLEYKVVEKMISGPKSSTKLQLQLMFPAR